MRRLIVVVILGLLAWKGYGRYQEQRLAASAVAPEAAQSIQPVVETPAVLTDSTRFACDGRTHCSQMTSCEEATYFIQHCPNTKMDGNNDGVPCERQWCR